MRISIFFALLPASHPPRAFKTPISNVAANELVACEGEEGEKRGKEGRLERTKIGQVEWRASSVLERIGSLMSFPSSLLWRMFLARVCPRRTTTLPEARHSCKGRRETSRSLAAPRGPQLRARVSSGRGFERGGRGIQEMQRHLCTGCSTFKHRHSRKYTNRGVGE